MNFRKMFAYRKSDGTEFFCGAKDVCRVNDGSTNTFLTEPRLIEEFLKKVEPHYSRACESLVSGNVQMDDVLALSGFVSFIIGCSPTAMRLGTRSLERLTYTEIELLDREGMLGPAPAELGGKTATELLQNGDIIIETDPKFPQAMGISGVVELMRAFATFHWDILINRQSDKFPFLTSDYPAAIEGVGRQIPAVRIVPLRPDLAIRIMPQIRPPNQPGLFAAFRYKLRKVSPSEVHKINTAIVRCAENIVFSPIRAGGIARLVRINAKYRIELEHTRTPQGTGFILLNSTVVKKRELEQK